MIKDRKIFSLKNFRGLDKENKPLKVAPFRASDGYNFIIDSDTLKTRPAFRLQNEIEFDLLNNEHIIDWYVFRNVKLYISNINFYIYDNGIKTPLSLGVPELKNFDGMKPIFKEEKEALFIFGLDRIYVFSIVDSIYVLYDLRTKPLNPFEPQSKYFEQYNDLPEVYVPTIRIGNNPFEDLNLLSASFKYDIFADSNEGTEGGKNVYYLPTHYDVDKHKGFTAEYEFYKGRFDNVDVYPLFLGINGENFEYNENINGTPVNNVVSTTPLVYEKVKMMDTFYPKGDFEFFGTPESKTDIRVIKGLTKKEFFQLRTTEQSLSTFEYVMFYVTTVDTSSWTTNKVLIFELPIEYNAVYRDETTNNILSIVREKTLVDVYIELHKFDFSDEIFITNDLTYQSEQVVVSTTPIETDFPPYPVVSSDREFTIPNSPFVVSGSFSSANVKTLSDTYLNSISEVEEIANAENINVKLRTIRPFNVIVYETVDFVDSVSSRNTGNGQVQISDFPAYPDFSGLQTDPPSKVIEYDQDFALVYGE